MIITHLDSLSQTGQPGTSVVEMRLLEKLLHIIMTMSVDDNVTASTVELPFKPWVSQTAHLTCVVYSTICCVCTKIYMGQHSNDMANLWDKNPVVHPSAS